jgi:hypothetical protein
VHFLGRAPLREWSFRGWMVGRSIRRNMGRKLRDRDLVHELDSRIGLEEIEAHSNVIVLI